MNEKLGLFHPKVIEHTQGVQSISWHTNQHGDFVLLGRITDSENHDSYGVMTFYRAGDEVKVFQDIPFQDVKDAIEEMFQKYEC